MRVSTGSNKKPFAIKLFQFCNLKTQKRYVRQEEVNISKREITSLVDSLRDFLKILITLASAYGFTNRGPNLRLDLQSQKTIFLLISITKSLNIQLDKSKKLNYTESFSSYRNFQPQPSLNSPPLPEPILHCKKVGTT